MYSDMPFYSDMHQQLCAVTCTVTRFSSHAQCHALFALQGPYLLHSFLKSIVKVKAMMLLICVSLAVFLYSWQWWVPACYIMLLRADAVSHKTKSQPHETLPGKCSHLVQEERWCVSGGVVALLNSRKDHRGFYGTLKLCTGKRDTAQHSPLHFQAELPSQWKSHCDGE